LNQLADGRGDLLFHLAKVKVSLGNCAGRDGMACDLFQDGLQDVRFCRRFGLRCPERGTSFPRIELAARGVRYSIPNQNGNEFRRDAGPREESLLAAQVMEHWAEFQESLSSQKRSYPTGKFEVSRGSFREDSSC